LIEAYLSGGVGNSTPAASLGGGASVTAMGGAAPGWYSATAIAGIALVDVFNCQVGEGSTELDASLTLYYNATGPAWTLEYKPRGTIVDIAPDSINSADVTSGGRVNLTYRDDANSILSSVTVDVTPASLPTTGAVGFITVADTATLNNLFSDSTVAHAQQGRINHRCVHLKNEYASSKDLLIYVLQQPSGSSSIDIGLDPAAVNDPATTIATETDAPTGVTFSRPSTSASGLAVTLGAGQTKALWIRQTLPPMLPVGGNPEAFIVAVEAT